MPRTLVALGLLALALVAVIVVACSDNSPSCNDGEFQLVIDFEGSAVDADTIKITGTDPGFTVSQTVAHTPSQLEQKVDVTFSGGYPADKLIHLTVNASSGSTPVGEGQVTIHTDPKCSVANAVVRSQVADMANTD